MSTPTRRSARGQTLPPPEAQILSELHDFNLLARCCQLYNAGWTLRAIGEAFDPAKSRSTMRSWVDRAANTTPTIPLPPIQSPELVTPEVYVPTKPASPGLTPLQIAEIKTLAPLARKYRSGMTSQNPATHANNALTDLCKRLLDEDVTIRELSEAADVTYRAMAKRVGRS